jgi:hypothetical protein
MSAYLLATVNIVSKKKVRVLWRITACIEQAQQIIELSVHIAYIA